MSFFLCFNSNIRARLICGSTPSKGSIASIRASSSSSPRMASRKWRGVIHLTLRCLAALPANLRTLAVRYSKMAVSL